MLLAYLLHKKIKTKKNENISKKREREKRSRNGEGFYTPKKRKGICCSNKCGMPC